MSAFSQNEMQVAFALNQSNAPSNSVMRRLSFPKIKCSIPDSNE